MKKALLTLLIVVLATTISLANTECKEKIMQMHDNGIVKEKLFIYDTHFKVISYFLNGSIEEIGYYDLKGEKTGAWIRYNEKGIIVAEANYKNDLKNGEWKIYNDEGLMTVYILYKKGKKKSICCWSEEKGLMVMK